jgi:hypothetical protein
MMISLVSLYAVVRARLVREEGAIALATLAFMIVLGLVAIVTLWSIAYATGAYNSLYEASQSAAYAAVGQTVPTASGSSVSQLDFNCNGGLDPGTDGNYICTGGTVMAVVDATFTASFPAPNGGVAPGFGLSWDDANTGEVQLANNNFQPANEVYAYYISQTPGAAEAEWKAASPSEPACPAYYSLDGITQDLICWGVTETNAAGPIGGDPHFSSGVVIYTIARVKIPGCFFCSTTSLDIAVAASQSQQTPQINAP